MSDKLEPKDFRLPPRTVLEKMGMDTIAIVMNRKSRIIMADGRKILEKAGKIQRVRLGVHVVLKTTAPVCSKTLKFLTEEGIEVIQAG